MGFLSSFGSCLSSACSAVCSAVSRAFSSGPLGVAFDKLATILWPKITEGTFDKIFEKIGKMVKAVGVFLGIIEEKDNLEELGAKVQQEDTKPREEFESNQAYLDYIKNQVTLDQEKFHKMGAEEKHLCKVAGLSLAKCAIEEKSGVKISEDFLVDAEKMDIKPEEFAKTFENFVKMGLKNMDLLKDVLAGKVTSSEVAEKVFAAVTAGIGEADQTLQPSEVEARIEDLAKKVNE